MTVNSTIAKASYTGNGVTRRFSIPFYFLDVSHVKVLLTNTQTMRDTVLSYETDYTIVNWDEESIQGDVMMVVPPTAYEKLTIMRDVPFTQLTHYVENDAFPAAGH